MLKKKHLPIGLMVFPLFFFSGCYSAGGLKHLAYQVSLVEAGRTSEMELVKVLGEPSEVKNGQGMGKTMIFKDLRRSRGRRVPLLAGVIGHETIDTVKCLVKDKVVSHCEYEEKIH